ncbi:Hsp20/alpha crystallin family protein [Brachyspira hampsonii]|uniref:Heat shock protein Hsp20 n=2 Tax=Brachyspira hampsonii TaxID=1287055 RepID=A0A2U4F163_9SPIR|nr:Hsp20/alpha crystallin family protein [Brachyspira hampsonii]EKV58022.1 heat shock protein Hsp20 [Brachyspira hampsonii 30446]MBW5389503.1 Hsp20/alpha crystallin family protein [Brachyspira hampsonii]MBW5393739.1 Hsp20/alpha crystallin family protein [Brachyspira hampsonii]OEJ14933.1 heat-shock protein Hsp20 [Brachyspira hampsonii]OEJ20589.1 heat-shock protein Hsp20 [Brachyspira hampsonii]
MTKRLFFPALHSMLDDFRSFDEAFGNLYSNDEVRKLSHYNIEEDDKSYTIEMDMPGVRKEDLEIGIKENVLSIYAERKKVSKEKLENSENKEENDSGNEVIVSKYEQSFNISTKGIDVENIEANLTDGVLKIVLPKKEEVKYEKKINIG